MPASTAVHDGPSSAFRISPAALALVVAAHMGIAWLLTVSRPSPFTPPQPPLMVEIIDAKAPTPPAPKTPDLTPPKPKPMARQAHATREQEAPVLAAKPMAPEPAVNEARGAPPVPLPAIQAPPAQAALAPHAVQVAAAAPTPPAFDANYLDNPKPAYPPISRREREQGKVLLRVYVDASGAAGKVELGTSSGHERLDKAALAAVSRWRFVPARHGAEAVAAWVTVPIIFSLKD
ncbi:MAG: energy transducer TonB [Aquabacterium sp.]|nr:energy transducer TonB [Aquabacterium sp.]